MIFIELGKVFVKIWEGKERCFGRDIKIDVESPEESFFDAIPGEAM